MLIDVSGRAVIPGIIDPHVHIRSVGHRNIVKIGVVTAVDVIASIEEASEITKSFNTGKNTAAVITIHHKIWEPHPVRR